jgi:hypothetical protein
MNTTIPPEPWPIGQDTLIALCERLGWKIRDRYDIDEETLAGIVRQNIGRMPGRTGLLENSLEEYARCVIGCTLRIELLMRGSLSSPLDREIAWVRLDAVRV